VVNERILEETLILKIVYLIEMTEDLAPIHEEIVIDESENEDGDSGQDSMSGLQDGLVL
jgi:hypothetical protein